MSSVHLLQPNTEEEWRAYYDLRWRLLRAPWNQPRGSEKDEFEKNAFHVLAKDCAGIVIGVGRIHFIEKQTCQIRYMAVIEAWRGQAVGTSILKELERYAAANGATRILLFARDSAVAFYQKWDYKVLGDAQLLFGKIRHKQMLKIL